MNPSDAYQRTHAILEMLYNPAIPTYEKEVELIQKKKGITAVGMVYLWLEKKTESQGIWCVNVDEVLELTRLVGNVGGERMNRYGGLHMPVIIPSGCWVSLCGYTVRGLEF